MDPQDDRKHRRSWGGVAAALLGVCFWRNWRKYRSGYPNHSQWRKYWTFVTFKSIADASLAGGLGWLCPPLLIAYCVLHLVRYVPDDPVCRTTFSVLAGLSLAAIGGWFLELVVVLGCFAADSVTGKFPQHWSNTKSET